MDGMAGLALDQPGDGAAVLRLLPRSQGLVREALRAGQLTSKLTHHVPVATYVSQVPSFRPGRGIWDYQRAAVILLGKNKEYSR